MGTAGAIVLIVVAAVCLVFAFACVKGSSGAVTLSGGPQTHMLSLGGAAFTKTNLPTVAQLRELLIREFSRLGIDPKKAVASAPKGSENAVFDLSASVIDPDGPAGPQPPTGVSLAWTERLIGDYDQDGEVGIPDITPIALKYQQHVTYDDPALHGGLSGWPAGNPEGGGAGNWRLARIDGDANGEIGGGDITPIALHYLERMDGYRVYRKGPGDTSFTLVANPDDAQSLLTLPRQPSPDNANPVRYQFSDSTATGGIVQFYVAVYDKASSQEGPASSTISVDLSTGQVNVAPTARLTVTPNYGPAPLEVTFDARASADPDGAIAEYRFDFDGDGIEDYSTLDPAPPETSSGGLATKITPGASSGVVTVTYDTGSADFRHPSVTVTDDAGADSAVASAQLGVTGWIGEVLYSPGNVVLPFSPQSISTDPKTQEIAVSGVCESSDKYAVDTGIYCAWRHSEGSWTVEIVLGFNDPGWDYGNGVGYNYVYPWLLWDETQQPLIVIAATKNSGFYGVRRILAASRSGTGVWTWKLVFEGYAAPSQVPRGPAPMRNCVVLDPGRYLFLCQDIYAGQNSVISKYYFLTYDHGNWSVEYANWDSAERNADLIAFDRGQDGKFYALAHIGDVGSAQAGLWWSFSDGVSSWSLEQIDGGRLLQATDIEAWSFVFGADGSAWIPVICKKDSETRELGFFKRFKEAGEFFPVVDGGTDLFPFSFGKYKNGAAFFYDSVRKSQTAQSVSLVSQEFAFCSGSSVQKELAYHAPEVSWQTGAYPLDSFLSSESTRCVIMQGIGGDFGQDVNWYQLFRRVDPLLGDTG